VRIGPACRLARGKNSRRTGFQLFNHRDPALDFQAGLFCQGSRWPHEDADNNEIGLMVWPPVSYPISINTSHGFAKKGDCHR